DVLVGGAGNDTIVGGGATDRAVYSGNRADYSVTYDGDTRSFTVADLRPGSPDGTDTVTGVELFQFADEIGRFQRLDGTVLSWALVSDGAADQVITVNNTTIALVGGATYTLSGSGNTISVSSSGNTVIDGGGTSLSVAGDSNGIQVSVDGATVHLAGASNALS